MFRVILVIFNFLFLHSSYLRVVFIPRNLYSKLFTCLFPVSDQPSDEAPGYVDLGKRLSLTGKDNNAYNHLERGKHSGLVDSYL